MQCSRFDPSRLALLGEVQLTARHPKPSSRGWRIAVDLDMIRIPTPAVVTASAGPDVPKDRSIPLSLCGSTPPRRLVQRSSPNHLLILNHSHSSYRPAPIPSENTDPDVDPDPEVDDNECNRVKSCDRSCFPNGVRLFGDCDSYKADQRPSFISARYRTDE